MDVRGGVLLLLFGAAPVLATTVVSTINNTSGIIEAPADPTGGASYEPNARYLWILDMQDSDVNIEMTVDKVDLGLPYTNIHDENLVNYTTGDFLLVGSGKDVLGGEEIMFFGSRKNVQKITILNGVGHIYFYSNANVNSGSGFSISFNSTAKVTTQPPTTTTPAPPALSNTFVSIIGIPVEQWSTYNNSFKEAMSAMGSHYLQPELNMTAVNVTPSDVIINDIKTCHPDFCPKDNCVAYDFSLATLADDQAVFSKWELEDMLADPSSNTYIEEEFGSGCKICDEDPKISTVAYIVIPTAVILFGIAFVFAAWKLTRSSSFSQSREKYEQTKMEKLEDQRRRSSGDISILGVGGMSIASQGSFSSRRFTMPFPKAKQYEESDIEEELEQDTTDQGGYTYFDPDQSIANPAQYGLGGVVTTFTRQGQEKHSYTNQAFVADEKIAADIQRASFANDSDSTDSENGGALSFMPKRRELTQRNQLEVSADVHSQHAEGETVL